MKHVEYKGKVWEPSHNEETLKAAEEYAFHNEGLNTGLESAFLAGCECKQKDIDDLFEALYDLVIAQNGPPLEREREFWQSAYDKANELIHKHNK
jgi:hypothetical protein